MLPPPLHMALLWASGGGGGGGGVHIHIHRIPPFLWLEGAKGANGHGTFRSYVSSAEPRGAKKGDKEGGRFCHG